ncbi:MAG: hypothetical protein ACYSWX_02555 [Planctomycetota bacterium]|jgi:hypothetical protein
MTDRDPAHQLAEALAEFERESDAPADGARLDRILVPLGELLLEGTLNGLAQTIQHVRGLIDPRRTAWEQVALDRAAESVREHLARLDDDATPPATLIAGRTALEARWVATEALELSADTELRATLEASDARLEERLGS